LVVEENAVAEERDKKDEKGGENETNVDSGGAIPIPAHCAARKREERRVGRNEEEGVQKGRRKE
jgi:hypothetical protein